MNVHQFVTVMAFTGHVAVHCANHNMEEQLVEVVDEAEKFLHAKQPIWIPTSTVEDSLLFSMLNFLQVTVYAFLGVSLVAVAMIMCNE
jgi:ABC-type cobalt transport system substrate-binding protein